MYTYERFASAFQMHIHTYVNHSEILKCLNNIRTQAEKPVKNVAMYTHIRIVRKHGTYTCIHTYEQYTFKQTQIPTYTYIRTCVELN